MDSIEKQLQELIDGVLDDSSNEVQRQALTEIVERDHSLVQKVIRQMRIHCLLQWECDELKVGLRSVSDARTSRRTPKPATGTLQFVARRWLWAAAVVLVAVGALTWHHLHVSSGNHSIVAEIVDEHQVTWADDTTAVVDGKRIVPGRLVMKSGELTLRFRSGATVSAMGDVALRIDSDMLIRLDRGQATAHVPQWAKGFTIKTPTAEVVDLGTKFGVVARNGGSTDVVVFEGQVDLKPTSSTADPQKRLSQGEGARVNNEGAIDRIMEIRRDSGGESWTTDLRLTGESVFKSVRDNLHSSDSAKYYQITPRGLHDDALAYVDRPHEWNGMTTDGLPDFLRGADYIRTFNETRYFSELEIVVEIARPSMVYILFDRRVKPPDWLTQQFEDLDVAIGLDEGPFPGDTKHSVAIGGGQSIDTVFSVWRRRCEKGDIMTLGPLGQNLKDCAMYGIAAQPMD